MKNLTNLISVNRRQYSTISLKKLLQQQQNGNQFESNYLNDQKFQEQKNQIKQKLNLDSLLVGNSRKTYHGSSFRQNPSTFNYQQLNDHNPEVKSFKPNSKWTFEDFQEQYLENLPYLMTKSDEWLEQQLTKLITTFEVELKDIIKECKKVEGEVNLDAELKNIMYMDSKKFRSTFLQKKN